MLAPQLPLPIPTPVARGAPDAGYPYPWSVYRWLDGELASKARIDDLTALRDDASPGSSTRWAAPTRPTARRPGSTTSSAAARWRRTSDEALEAIDELGDEVPRDAVLRAWEDAMSTTWDRDAGLAARRRRGREPARARRAAGRRARLRLVGRRRPRLRPRHRVDVPLRARAGTGSAPSSASMPPPGRAAAGGRCGRRSSRWSGTSSATRPARPRPAATSSRSSPTARATADAATRRGRDAAGAAAGPVGAAASSATHLARGAGPPAALAMTHAVWAWRRRRALALGHHERVLAERREVLAAERAAIGGGLAILRAADRPPA